MNDWILINKFEVAKANEKKARGNATTMLPPHMIPEAVKAEIIDKMIVLDFRYDTISEAQLEKAEKDGVVVVVGETTRRVYKISVPMSQVKAAAQGKAASTNPPQKASFLARVLPQSWAAIDESGALYSVQKYSNEIGKLLAVAA